MAIFFRIVLREPLKIKFLEVPLSKLSMELKLASLGHISLDGSKPVLSEAEGFKANTSKHKAMSYGCLKEREQALCAVIDDLIEKAKRCDQEEDKAYQEKTGYEIPDDLKFKASAPGFFAKAKMGSIRF